MAVIQKLPGIEICIAVAGAKLPEVIKAKCPERQVGNEFHESKFIEKVAPGKEFAICLTVKSNFVLADERLGFKIIVDGVKCRSPSVRKASLAGGDWVHKIEGTVVDAVLKRFTFRDTRTDGRYGKIEILIYGLPAVQSRQMQPNPLGGLVFAYTSASNPKECERDSKMPAELKDMQNAIPSLQLDCIYKFMSEVEVHQLVGYLRSLKGQNCNTCRLESRAQHGNKEGYPSTPEKPKLESGIHGQHMFLPIPPSTTVGRVKRQRDPKIDDSPSKRLKSSQGVVDLTSDTE